MIVVCHIFGCLAMSWFGRKYDKAKAKENIWDEKLWSPGESLYILSGKELTFNPPCYVQRYIAVCEVLKYEISQSFKISKVVDFGCAELSFFLHLKTIPQVSSVVAVDIDENLMKRYACKAEPLLCEYLYKMRETPLNVKVCCGSVDQYDPCLSCTDAVVAIELIEHLYEKTLIGLRYNIFGRICPRLAIFTTPNAEFNVLFPNFSGMRHDDHKFEWNRKQFQEWAAGIVADYPEYSVKLYGIGPAPEGSADVGCCSQMAVFRREAPPPAPAQNNESTYTIIQEYDYKYFVDERSVAEKTLDEVRYRLYRLSTPEVYNCDTQHYEIPLTYILPFVSEYCPTLHELRDILQVSGWALTDSDDPKLLVPDDSGRSDTEEECYEEPNNTQDWPDMKQTPSVSTADEWLMEPTENYCSWDEQIQVGQPTNSLTATNDLGECISAVISSSSEIGPVKVLENGDNLEGHFVSVYKGFNADSHDEMFNTSAMSNCSAISTSCDAQKSCTADVLVCQGRDEYKEKDYVTRRKRHIDNDEKEEQVENVWKAEGNNSVSPRMCSSMQYQSTSWWSTCEEARQQISEEKDCSNGLSKPWGQVASMEDAQTNDHVWEQTWRRSRTERFVRQSHVNGSSRLAKSFSLDSCLENINCERAEVQAMYLSMHSRARTLESGSPSERGLDSGYPISFSQDLSEQPDLNMSDDSLSGGEGDDPGPARPLPPRSPPPLVENGDLANNNRDGEGNNVEGVRNPLPPPFHQEEFPPWLLQLLWMVPARPVPALDEGLGDSDSELSDSPGFSV